MKRTNVRPMALAAYILIAFLPIVSPTQGQEKKAPPSLEELVPEGTIAIASIPDVAGLIKGYRQSIIGNLVDYFFSNDFQVLLRHFELNRARDGFSDFRKEFFDGVKRETGMTFEELLNLFDGECAVALVDIGMEKKVVPDDEGFGPPPMKVDVVAKIGWKDPVKGESLLRSLLKKGPKLTESEVLGCKVFTLEMSPVATPQLAVTPSCMVFATQTATMNALLASLKSGKGIEKPLAKEEGYRIAMRSVKKEEAATLFYVNWNRVVNLLPVQSFFEKQAPDVLDDLGIAGLKGIATSFHTKEGFMRDIVFLQADAGERKGVLKILSTPKTETKDGLVVISEGDFSCLSFGGVYSPNIAVIAAIAVPSLMRSETVSNERVAIGSLKTIRDMNVLFKSMDDDRNTWNDYWTADVSGLYRVLNAAGMTIRKIELPLAIADGAPIGEIAGYVGAPLAKTPTPKAGYFFRAMTTDENGNPYNQNEIYKTTTKALNESKFAFCAYPAEYDVTGKNIYIVSQDGTIWKKDTGSNTPILQWPAANPKTAGWSNID